MVDELWARPAGDPSSAALRTKPALLQHPRHDRSSLIGPQLDVKQFVLAEGAANDLIKQSRRKKIAVWPGPSICRALPFNLVLITGAQQRTGEMIKRK